MHFGILIRLLKFPTPKSVIFFHYTKVVFKQASIIKLYSLTLSFHFLLQQTCFVSGTRKSCQNDSSLTLTLAPVEEEKINITFSF